MVVAGVAAVLIESSQDRRTRGIESSRQLFDREDAWCKKDLRDGKFSSWSGHRSLLCFALLRTFIFTLYYPHYVTTGPDEPLRNAKNPGKCSAAGFLSGCSETIKTLVRAGQKLMQRGTLDDTTLAELAARSQYVTGYSLAPSL